MSDMILSKSSSSEIFYKIDEYFGRSTKQHIERSPFFINIANSKLHFAGNFTSLLEHPISGIFPENYYFISELKGLDRVSRLSDYLTGQKTIFHCL